MSELQIILLLVVFTLLQAGASIEVYTVAVAEETALNQTDRVLKYTWLAIVLQSNRQSIVWIAGHSHLHWLRHHYQALMTEKDLGCNNESTVIQLLINVNIINKM